MDNPFSADNSNPFLTPYQAPGELAPTPGIKPFTAVDLAPPAGMNGNRHTAPPAPGPSPFAAAPAQAPSPFSDGGFSNAFLGREAPPIQATAPAAPAPASSLAQALSPSPSPAHAAPVVNPFTGKAPPVASAPVDFSPVPDRPMPAPVAAPVQERPAVPKPAPVQQKPTLSMTDAPEPARAARGGFLLTTSPSAEGRRIGVHLGVVSVEIVIPKDILFRNPAPYGELHRIKAAEDQLQAVKKKAFEELTERARLLGADGIVGATLQFSQFDAVVFLCSAVGSAVKFE